MDQEGNVFSWNIINKLYRELSPTRQTNSLGRVKGVPRNIRPCMGWWKNKDVKMMVAQKVKDAIRYGTLQQAPCEICGNKTVQAHHDHYSDPLMVRWLCVKHHREYHQKLFNAIARELKEVFGNDPLFVYGGAYGLRLRKQHK